MAPDLNSLPPSPSPSSLSRTVSSSNMAEPTNSVPQTESPPSDLPRSATTSLQAAATLNAGLLHESIRSEIPVDRPRRGVAIAAVRPCPNRGYQVLTAYPSGPPNGSIPRARRESSSTTPGRRRSAVMMNLHLNDPSIPAPGEMVNDPASQTSNGYATSSPQLMGSPMMLPRDPHHQRNPSLGELHQELEAEQEAQVNRLLQTIRQQQLQLMQLQVTHGQPGEESAVSSQAGSAPQSALPGQSHTGSFAHSPWHTHPRVSFDMARADLNRRSRTPSRGASPRLRSTSISGELGDGAAQGRDESAFYQAETAMLIRENQMLRHRIRELEKQLSDPTTGSVTHEPSHHSYLMQSTSAARGTTPIPPDATASTSK